VEQVNFKSTITKKLWLIFGLVLTILSATLIVYYWQTQRINNSVSKVVDIQESRQQAVFEMKFNTANIARLVSDYITDNDLIHLEEIRGFETNLEMNAANLNKLRKTDGQNTLGNKISTLCENFKDTTYKTTALAAQQHNAIFLFHKEIDEINFSLKEMYQATINGDSPEALNKLEVVINMQSILVKVSSTVETYTTGYSTDSQQGILVLQEDFTRFGAMYRETRLSAYENSWLTHIDQKFERIVTNGIDILTITKNLYKTYNQFKQSFHEIDTYLGDHALPLVQAELHTASKNVRDSTSSAGIWLLILVLTGIASGTTAVFIFSRKLTGPIQDLKKGASIVESGRINYRFNTNIKGEFGQLAGSFNKMLNNLGRLHEMLEESEEQAWSLLDVTSDEVIMTDLRGTILASNESAALRSDMSIEQMINESYYNLLPAELSALMKVHISEAIRLNKSVHYEDEWDGKIIDRNILPIFNQKKEITRLAIFSRDITVHKWVEDVSEQLGRRNALILNAAGEGIFGLDTQGITTFVNPAATSMLGYKSEELVGKRHHELVHYSKPDGKPYLSEQCPIYKAFKDGAVHTNVDDEVFWQKDGTPFPVEYTSTPIIADNRILGAVVTFRDITDRKRIEKMLYQSEEKYRSIVESAASLIISIDEEGTIIDCNTRIQQMLDYAPVEIVKHKFLDLIHPVEHEKIRECLEDALNKGFKYNNQFRMARKDGTFLEVNLNVATVRDANGDYIRTVCMIGEIT